MNDNVVESVVRGLKDVLSLAEAGEVSAVSISYATVDGKASFLNSGILAPYSLVGAIECAKSSLLSCCLEYTTECDE